jgi:hypothetical protein
LEFGEAKEDYVGFFKDILDASPHKSIQRAKELHQSGITSISELPHFMHESIFDCSICKARFGKIFAKDKIPLLVTTERQPSFSDNDPAYVVCQKCVIHFQFKPIDEDGWMI